MTVALECRRSGRRRDLPVQRWHEPATLAEIGLVTSTAPPVLDVGCGPGRMVAALAALGIPALGIDVAPQAVRHARELGAPVLHRSVFSFVPGEGRWSTVLLLDGNVGIGGDPCGLIGRCAELAQRGGQLLVEVDGPNLPSETTEVRLVTDLDEPGPWFPWATVSVDDIESITIRSGVQLDRVVESDGRFYAVLRVGPP